MRISIAEEAVKLSNIKTRQISLVAIFLLNFTASTNLYAENKNALLVGKQITATYNFTSTWAHERWEWGVEIIGLVNDGENISARWRYVRFNDKKMFGPFEITSKLNQPIRTTEGIMLAHQDKSKIIFEIYTENNELKTKLTINIKPTSCSLNVIYPNVSDNKYVKKVTASNCSLDSQQ